jgi:type IV secretion system protein VirD4
MVEERRATDRPYTQNCINLLSDYLRGNEDMVQGIRKQVTSTMGIWFNPKVIAATSKSDFDLRDLRRKKMTIYIGVMPSDLVARHSDYDELASGF